MTTENKTERSLVEKAATHYRYCQIYAEYYKQSLDYGTGETYSSAELQAVLQIHTTPGITITEIARYGARTKSAVSQIMTKLENRELIFRQKTTQRGVGLFVTDKGRELCEAYQKFIEKNLSGILADCEERFGKDTMDNFYEIMHSVINAVVESTNQE